MSSQRMSGSAAGKLSYWGHSNHSCFVARDEGETVKMGGGKLSLRLRKIRFDIFSRESNPTLLGDSS